MTSARRRVAVRAPARPNRFTVSLLRGDYRGVSDAGTYLAQPSPNPSLTGRGVRVCAPTLHRRRALTLAEMAISTVLVSVLIVAAVSAVGGSKNGQRITEDQQRGHQLAHDLMAEILQQEYADDSYRAALEQSVLIGGLTYSVPLGPEISEATPANRSLFDDIDDYHGWSASPPQEKDGSTMDYLTDWARTVAVQYVKDDDPNTLKAQDEGAKLITISVSRNNIEHARLVALRTAGPPPTESCCLPDGTCADMLASVCTSLGGTPQGPDTSCALTSCEPPERLLAHWPMDEDTGGTITDETSGLVGTIHGAGWRSGLFGTALNFDGSNDYVEIPHSDDFLLDDGTVSIWFRADTLPSRAGLVGKDSQNFDTGGHLLIYTEGSTLKVRFQSASADYFVNAPSSLSTGTWRHVAFTFGSEGVKLYLDGTLRDSDPYTGGMGTTSGGIGNYEPWALGANNWASGNLVVTPLQNYYNGKLDDFRVYNYALSPDEIAVLIAGGDP